MNDDERRLADLLHRTAPQPSSQLDVDDIMREHPVTRRAFRYWPQLAAAAAVVVVAAGTATAVSLTSNDHRTPAVAVPASAGRPGAGKPPVVLGDKNFPEQYVLGELYAQALRAKGFTVQLKQLNTSEAADRALTKRQIGMYPEYTGVIYNELAKHTDNPNSDEKTLAGATKYENEHGRAVLTQTPFQDADGVAVTRAYAQRHGLRTVADLRKVGQFTYGGAPEYGHLYRGAVGLRSAYGLKRFDFVGIQADSQYQALDQGKIDAAAVFTTAGQLASGKYTVLTDPKHIFGFQHVVPVVSKSVLAAEGPAFEATLNAVSRLLTTDTMIRINQAVVINNLSPAVYAHEFLQANNLD